MPIIQIFDFDVFEVLLDRRIHFSLHCEAMQELRRFVKECHLEGAGHRHFDRCRIHTRCRLFESPVRDLHGAWLVSVVAESAHRRVHAFHVVVHRCVRRADDENRSFLCRRHHGFRDTDVSHPPGWERSGSKIIDDDLAATIKLLQVNHRDLFGFQHTNVRERPRDAHRKRLSLDSDGVRDFVRRGIDNISLVRLWIYKNAPAAILRETHGSKTRLHIDS